MDTFSLWCDDEQIAKRMVSDEVFLLSTLSSLSGAKPFLDELLQGRSYSYEVYRDRTSGKCRVDLRLNAKESAVTAGISPIPEISRLQEAHEAGKLEDKPERKWSVRILLDRLIASIFATMAALIVAGLGILLVRAIFAAENPNGLVSGFLVVITIVVAIYGYRFAVVVVANSSWLRWLIGGVYVVVVLFVALGYKIFGYAFNSAGETLLATIMPVVCIFVLSLAFTAIKEW
jgi:hypothetical protein